MSAQESLVRFGDCTFLASRPEILQYLVDCRIHCWGGWLVEFHGTSAELVAAGLATADLFEIGKSGQRKHRCEFGDDYDVKRIRGGKFSLTITCNETMHWPRDSELDPNGKGYRKKDDRKRWLKNGGAEAEAATAEILKRFAR